MPAIPDIPDSALNPVVQVVLGVVLTWAIYMLALVAMKADKLAMDKKIDPTKKNKIDVFSGFVESSGLVNKKYNTIVQRAPNYLPITPSFNIKGGAQFTYSMWLNIGDAEKARNVPIFMKGEPKKYNFQVKDNTLPEGVQVQARNDYVAYCPMLAFGAKDMEFVVKFNTAHKMDQKLEIQVVQSENSIYRKNMLPLFNKKWVCITIVFEDNMPINDFENGLVVRFYVNDTLYQTGKYATNLKQNNGDLCFFPDGAAVPQLKISNFTYWNYALTDNDIKAITASGPSNKPATLSSNDSVALPYYVNDYNKLDIYNTGG